MKPIALTVQEAARVSGISRSEIYVAIKLGKLPAKKHGKRTLIGYTDLESYVNNLPPWRPEGECGPNGGPKRADPCVMAQSSD